MERFQVEILRHAVHRLISRSPNARIDRVRAEKVTMSERVDRALRSNALLRLFKPVPVY